MFETIILIGSGLFALFCCYQKEEFKSSLQKQAKTYCEEEIFKIERSHEFKISVLNDELHEAKEMITKLRASKEKAVVVKKETVIEKALASFI
jgi:hypothetical protein